MKSASPLGAQLQEALVMASMVSLRNDLSVELGEWWSFNWKTHVITIPLKELEERPEERIAWIILHEAAHAALTRFHEILPTGLLERPEIHHLLNAIEDVRIEEWLVGRFPGARRWREVCRNLDSLESPGPASEDPRAREMGEFLRGIFALGEGKPIAPETSPRVLEALEQVREPLARAIECQPPVNTSGDEVVSRLYPLHPVSVCYQYLDHVSEPKPFEKWVRMMQATMWAHLVEGVLPVYMRLLNLPPLRQQGFQEVVQVRSGVLSGEKRSASEMQRALRQQLTHLNAAPYLRVVEEHREEIGRVSRLLEDLLPNHRGLRHRRGCRSGDRIDLRVAAQVEADRRLLERLWMQRKRRTLPDPAFVFVMDRSDSMKGHSRSGAAFASMVVVREACTRHKIPFAVIAFNDHPVVIHEWERLDDEKAQAALGLVLEPDNGTDLVAAVAMAGKLIAPRPERDRFVFVLTDGDVPEQQAVEVCALKQTIEETGVHFAAIGLDVDPTGFGRVFPGAPVIRQSSQLPAVMADLLVRVQTEAA